MIRRSGQTRKVPNNCQAVSGVTVRPSYCAGISSVSYCSLLTKPPNPFCSANERLIPQKRPNFRIRIFALPNAAPCTVPPGAHAPLRPPPFRRHCLYVCLLASISPELYYLTVGYVPDRELFVRWTALTAFMPAMQFSLAPWNYDDETVAIVRKFAELHATTIGDEIEAVAKEAVEHGITTVFFTLGRI